MGLWEELMGDVSAAHERNKRELQARIDRAKERERDRLAKERGKKNRFGWMRW